MLDDLFDFLARILFQIILWFFQWLLLLPVVILISTPIILVAALFGKHIYRKNVELYYELVFDWWRRAFIFFP